MLSAKSASQALLTLAAVIIAFYGGRDLTRVWKSDIEPQLRQLLQGSDNNTVLGTSDITNQQFIVERVVDGDTIKLTNGQTVRYIGIDTPESKHPQKEVECFALDAAEANRQLVEGKKVTLEKDVSDTDRYGRLLRYVYINDIMVNQKLVADGFAQAVSFPPDIKYQDQLMAAEQQAREQDLGLWGSCEL